MYFSSLRDALFKPEKIKYFLRLRKVLEKTTA
jgi:hypothetical protein